MALAANFATSTAGAVDTSDKFATDVNDTGGKLAAGVKLPPLSTTPAANLPLCQRRRWQKKKKP